MVFLINSFFWYHSTTIKMIVMKDDLNVNSCLVVAHIINTRLEYF